MNTRHLLLLSALVTLPATANHITDNTWEDRNIQTSDTVVAWESKVDDADWEIMVRWNGVTTQVTENTGDDINVRVMGDLVVWQSWDGTDWEIWGYNAASNLVMQLTDNTIDDIEPMFAGTDVIYRSQVDGADFEIASVSVGMLVPIEGSMKLTPQALNLRANGRWVNASLTFDDPAMDGDDLDPSSILLAGSVPVEAVTSTWGRTTVRFDRQALSAALEGESGPTQVTLTATTIDGRTIVFSDTIKVIP